MRARSWPGCPCTASPACRTRPPSRCAIPGRATSISASGCCAGELEFGGGVLLLRPGLLERPQRDRAAADLCARLHLAAAFALAWHRSGAAAGARPRVGLDGVLAVQSDRPPPGRRRRADHRLARPLRFLRRHRRRSVPPAADVPAGRRCAIAVRRAAGRGTRCPRADRAERPDRGRHRAAGARRLSGARAAVPAARDGAPGVAGRHPRRTQPLGATDRVAGSDGDPRAAAGRPGRSRRPSWRGRSSRWRRRCGPCGMATAASRCSTAAARKPALWWTWC